MLSKGVKYMLVATFFFALMQLCVKFLAHIPAHEIILFRSGVSFIVSFSLLKYYKIPVWGNNKKYLVLRGVFGVIALTLFFVTLQYLPLAGAVTIQYLSPIFTALFAVYLLKEKMRPLQWVYFGLAFMGIVLIKGFDERINYYYLALGIVSSVFSGLAYTCVRKLRNTDHPLVVVLYFPLIATPIMAVYSFYQWVQPVGYDWLWLILTGVFTQFAQVSMTKSLHYEKANKVAILKYLGIIYALLIGFVFFDETYTWMSLAGMLLVVGGVALNVLLKTKSNANHANLEAQ